MGLKAETPAGMLEAVLDCKRRVGVPIGPVHRLQEEVLEMELLDLGGAQGRLGKNKLELVAAAQDNLRTRLRAHTDPVDLGRRLARPVGFYGDPEAAVM